MNRTNFATVVTVILLGLSAGPAMAHGDEDHGQDKKPEAAAPTAMPAQTISAQRLPDGSLFVPKSVQHQLGLRTIVAEMKDIPISVEFNGKVIADPNASGRVQATQSGRIEPGAKGLPTLGQKVSKGQALAWLRPVASSIDRGNQQSQLADLESQLAIAERRARRFDQLEGAVPQKEIEAAHFELDALKKRRAAVGASISTLEPLLAPVSGVISVANAVAGQVVEAKEILFEVVDPTRLAVEALAYDPAQVEGLVSASAQVPDGTLELTYLGSSRQLREQAMPLLFRVKSTSAALAVGQPLKVTARTSRITRGIALPKAALARNSGGEIVVWIHADAERFVPRKANVQPLDATNSVLTAGTENGERIVTVGADLLAQIR